MALSDMFGLLGGGSSDPLDIYGDLFTKEQKAALQQRSMDEGLLRMAGAFGAAAQPSRMPTSFMGALGQAAGAMAGHGDEAAERSLKGMEVAEKVRQSRQERAILAKAAPLVEAITRKLIGAGVPAAQAAQIATQVAAPPGQTASATPAVPAGAPPPAAAPYLGPTNEELGAPPLAAPGGTRPGALPARIGMRGTGPNAIMIDLDTGQPIQSSPNGPITMPPPPAGQQNTGLLPPQDQVVGPDGQPLTGQGVFPSMLASLQGPGGTPGGPLPFRLASATSSPSGATPGAAGPSRDDPRGVVPYIRERAIALGIDPDVAERVARSEGVGTFQSSVIQKSGRREPSFGAFQLYTGGGMGNDFQRDTGLDPADPKNEKATIDYALKNAVHTGWTPWHGAKGAGIGPRTGLPGGPSYAEGGGDTVIPSGRGIPASALRNVADTGAAPGGSGTIPGLDITPEALAGLNAMLKMGGMKSDPFGSLLETYYKSPGYLGEKTTAETKARTGVEDPINRRMELLKFGLQMRKDGFILGEDGKVTEDPDWAKINTRRTDETESLKAKYQEQVQTRVKDHEEKITIRQEQRADQREIVPAYVYGPNGQVAVQEMPRGEKVEKLKNQTMNPGQYKPGDIITKPVGEPPPEHQWQMTPQGELKAVPVPGSPAAAKAAEVARTQGMADRTLLRARDIMSEDTARIEQTMKSSLLPVTGFWGSLLSSAPGTPQHDVKVTIDAIKARTSLDSINATRAATGSTGLGQITMGEHGMLASAVAALEQSQTKEAFLLNLRRVNAEYNNLISSPAFRGTLPKETVVVPPQPSPNAPPPASGAPRIGRYNPATGRVEFQ